MKTVAKMKEIVPEYKSNNSIYEQLDKTEENTLPPRNGKSKLISLNN